MVLARPGRRTSTRTWRAWLARNTAAWPAEFPPPSSGHVLVVAQPGLDGRRPVRDAAALEPRRGSESPDDDSARRWRSRPRAPGPAGRRRARGCARDQDRSSPERSPARLTSVDRLNSAPNFCACVKRASHQRLTRDAGRKAQVVLDARAGAGLASERDRFQHHDGEALGRAVDRRRKTGRTRADDGHVVRFGAEARRHQPQRRAPAPASWGS